MITKRKSTRFNFVSETSDGFGFAKWLQDEDEAVRLWIRNPEARSVGDNIVPKVGDMEDLLHDADRESDVFVFDTSGNGICADYFASLGYAVLGGSVLADRLERDRNYGASVMESAGIEVPETKSFDSFESGIKFVEENPDVRWVYKPSKQLGDLSPSHVSYDTEDLVEMLRNIEKDVSMADPQFELQAFEKGVAFSTELWFQHGEFIEPLTNHTLERKELMNGDIGPSGGCLGNLTWFCQGCLVCQQAKQLRSWALREGYHGMLDLNVIVTEQGRVYGLEFTPRFGYDASPTLLGELVKGGIGSFFADAARGQFRSLDLREMFAGAVRVTIPPWPTEKYTAEENVPIRGVDERGVNSDAGSGRTGTNTYWYNVKADDSGNLCSAGAWGIVCLFTAHSSNLHSVMARPVDACKGIRVKNKQYRTDLEQQFKSDLAKLESAGVKLNIESTQPIGIEV